MPSEKKNRIEQLVKLLESQNPTPEPTLCLDKVLSVLCFFIVCNKSRLVLFSFKYSIRYPYKTNLNSAQVAPTS